MPLGDLVTQGLFLVYEYISESILFAEYIVRGIFGKPHSITVQVMCLDMEV